MGPVMMCHSRPCLARGPALPRGRVKRDLREGLCPEQETGQEGLSTRKVTLGLYWTHEGESLVQGLVLTER